VRISYFIVFVFLLSQCNSSPEKEKTVTSQPKTENNIDSSIQDEKPFYAIFRYDKQGKITDSITNSNFNFSRITTDKKQSFPDGWAFHQLPLGDSLLRICEPAYSLCEEFSNEKTDDSLYCKKEGPILEKFQNTAGKSYFRKENIRNYYFFLTLIDTSDFFVQDTHYGLLHFMKLKQQRYKNAFAITYGEEDYVNICTYQEIKWKDPIIITHLEHSRVYASTFQNWYEVWECGEKYDYAPTFPYIDIKPNSALSKSFLPYSEEDEIARFWDSPDFVFSYIRMDESADDPLKKLNVKSYSMQLMTKAGKVRKGKGLDLNNDKHADVFWYNHYDIAPLGTRYTILYLKIDESWTPFYYQCFNDFTSLN